MEDYTLNPESPSQSESTPLNRDLVKKHYEHQFNLIKEAIQLCRDVWENWEAYGKAEKFVDLLQEIILNARIDRKEGKETHHFYSREIPAQVNVRCDNHNIHALLYYPSAIVRVWINLGEDNSIYVDVSDL